MLKNLTTIGLFVFLLSQTSSGHAQALPTATGRGAFQVGGGWSLASPDYGQKNIQGISAFADLDLGLHWGVEGDIHYLSLITPTDLAEDSYFVGPRFIYPRGRFKLYAKAMIGVGDLVIQETQDNQGVPAGTNFAYSLGGGVDIPIRQHIVIRAFDFEFQHWQYLTGLTPMVYTVGAAYRFR